MPTASEIMGGGFSAGQALAIGGRAGTVAAAGSTQGTATTIVASLTIVTAADGTKGVILPAASVGDEYWIENNSGSTLKVYPPTGAAIAVPGTGLGSANAAYSQTTYAVCVYKAISSTQWFVVKSA